MGRCSSVGHGSERISRSEHAGERLPPYCRAWLPVRAWLLLALLLLLSWPAGVQAMRPDRVAQLRQETVEMFYHGYDNYMEIAFPEDEVSRVPQKAIKAHLRRDLLATTHARRANVVIACSYGQYRVSP